MPLLDKLSGIVHRGNSEKNMNNTNTTATNTTAHTAPVVKTYELPAETTTTTTTSAPLVGKTYVLPADDYVETVTTTSTAAPILSQNVYSESTYIQGANRASVRNEPTIIETIQKDVVIHERIHPVEKEEIQPIIYREREQLDVKQVTQMMHETQIQPTIVQQRELAAEVREAVVERGAPIQENIVLPSVQRDATLRTQQIHAPIIEETIKKTVIEEVQPVLERDVIVPTIIQNTQPIYEKIVEAPTVYREVRAVQELGTREYSAPVVAAPAPVIIEREVLPATLQVVPITTTTTVETYDHKLNPIETRDFINNRGLPLR